MGSEVECDRQGNGSRDFPSSTVMNDSTVEMLTIDECWQKI